VLGAASNAPLRATSQGWKIAGVAWYWWVLTIGVGMGLYFWVKVSIDKFFARVANDQQ
jgi:hypothetical protein